MEARVSSLHSGKIAPCGASLYSTALSAMQEETIGDEILGSEAIVQDLNVHTVHHVQRASKPGVVRHMQISFLYAHLASPSQSWADMGQLHHRDEWERQILYGHAFWPS